MMRTVHFLRGGAPDKIDYQSTGSYKLIKHDRTNLVDYSVEELVKFAADGDYVLPADEYDIKHANKLLPDMLTYGCDQSKIMLPLAKVGKHKMVIPYDNFVPKDSKFYQGISANTLLVYPKTVSYTIDEFKKLDWKSFGPCCIKVQIGSGSRGCVVYNPDHYVENTREQVNELTQKDIDGVIKVAKKTGCKILVQDLCRTDLYKYELQIIIRNGKMLCYKWEYPDGPSTNWDHGWFIRTPYTNKVAESIVDYMVNILGVTDAITGMDGYTNYKDYTDVIENNHRWENCTFTWNALGIDPIHVYLNEIDCNSVMPYTGVATEGLHYCRYWHAKLVDNIQGYQVGK